MNESIKKLLMLFNKKEKKKLIMLLFMMILAALFETLGIGLIVYFVNILTNPAIILEQPIVAALYRFFNFQSTTDFFIISVVMLLAVFIIKNLYLLLFQYAQTTLIRNQQVELSTRLFKVYLTNPYTFHLQKNSADLLRNVSVEVYKVLQGIVLSGFMLITELLVITCILVLLVVTAPLATITGAILLGGSVYLFFKTYRKKLIELGKKEQLVNGKRLKWINQGLGASKEVKVSGKERFFVNSYAKQNQIYANIVRFKLMVDQTPRLFLETLLVSVVLLTILINIFQGINSTHFVSTLALFAMSAFRLLPSLSRVIAMISSIRFNKPALDVIYEDLFTNTEKTASSPINHTIPSESNGGKKLFNDSIQLSDVSFRYPNQKEYAIKDVSLTIPIGKSVAFIGESGAGKTTLVDIILGLFPPEKGSILVDGNELQEIKSLWQQKIGYIPQSIFLSDDSIRRNVAFGIDSGQIDDEAVWKALEQAQLKDFVEALPDKLDTSVGERGIRLSGGQRQRIGIARALYHNPEILFMDEATSALDNETEKEIMKAIDHLKGEKTLIIIAHRLSTIEKCDIIFNINKARLVAIDHKLEQSVI